MPDIPHKKPRPKKHRRVSRIPAEVRRDLTTIGLKHKKLCAGNRNTQQCYARFYRTTLLDPRKRGAKPTTRVSQAVTLLKALGSSPTSKDWQRIYQECITGFAKLNYAERCHEADKLRHAALASRKRERIRASKSGR